MNVRTSKFAAAATLGIVSVFGLAACSGNDGGVKVPSNGASSSAGSSSKLSGSLAGSGASSAEAAQSAWTQNFMALNPGASVTYDAVGSGKGREQFLSKGVVFAGSDKPLSAQEITSSKERCFGGQAFDIPIYISPIAVVYKLDGVKDLQLSPDALAGIFSGKITKWNDPAIKADNPNANLPDKQIVPVHRADKSGTTENFTEYLSKNSPQTWTAGAVETWPNAGGQSGDGTTGLIKVVEGGDGTIGYADASKAGNLSTAKIKVGDKYVGYTPEEAAKAVEISPRAQGRSDHDIVVELDRTTKEAGTYPLVLVSYLAVCDTYQNQQEADLVKAYADYIVSTDGQQAAHQAAGSAPLTTKLSDEAKKAISSIKAKA
ncbi:phosphate ABC transporter substrate-binding protein PstS [Devriesea agamarum]|uniref:phosphate ABC transporter substrate-binding protein PstS n=1 Tax=Devriesea agamarum TaxID=472569 RepID=UPI00071DC478|nr:phosphate ABC transporter substrate-binding protein PstS [Devriesea agamarum]